MKLWSLEGTLLHTWTDHRYIDVVGNRTNNLIAFYTGSMIKILDIDTKEVVKDLEEEDKVRSITMSKDGEYVLANCSESEPEIKLWSIEHGRVIQKYTGHKQSKYVLKCGFGGKYENYIICGSEDDKIYIWNRISGDLLERLSGHTDTVNTTAWSYHIPNFFFSSSDDQTIKVWGTEENLQVKVTIASKFKQDKEDDLLSGNNSEDNILNNADESESIGDSSMSEDSVFSDEP